MTAEHPTRRADPHHGEEDRREPSGTADIQVIARAAEVLRVLTSADGIDVPGAAAALGIGRSSAHRYLSSMERHGFLSRRDRNTYEAGALMTQLGAIALSRSGVIRVAGPIMEALRDEVRQTIALALWNGDTAVVAHVVEDASRTAHVTLRVGIALGREAAQTAVFQAFTPQGPSRRSGSVAHSNNEYLTSVRTHGVAVRDSIHDGVRAVAVPVRDPSGAVIATIAAVGITLLVPDAIDSPVAKALKRGSADITEALVVTHGGIAADAPTEHG